MSGIVGILHLDGRPVEADLLEHLTGFLAFRGPDAQQVWLRGPVGFGLALLRTTAETERYHPFSLDGHVWIVADARVDDRRSLETRLRAHGHDSLAAVSDAELILRAYHTWGQECLQHLLGDFTFAIWDEPCRRLFCARDQMGVKPFFYAHVGSLVIFSNTLDCIRQHPAVSDTLNDLAIADFLLFDMNQDPVATSFADIRRLPPAHVLTCEQGNVSLRRYWTFPAPTPILYRRHDEYIEHFCHLLDTAVADRLRADSAGVLMSGGLDSPTVAASAQRLLSCNGNAPGLRAYTQVFDSLIPHEERYYAGLVAQALKIPIEYRADDLARLFEFAEQPEHRSPQPVHSAWPDVTADQLRRVAIASRVVLTGFGADPLFSSRITVHFRELLGQKRFGRALADAARYLSAEGRLSRLYLRTRWRLLFAPKGGSAPYPPWLNERLEQRLGLRDHWEQVNRTPPPATAFRPEAHELTFAPFWSDLFETHDPGVTRVAVEVRHPFFDLRLMNFLLALPRLPWCCDKQLLREAARGVLPEAVRLRRKSPLQADPLLKLLEQPEAAWVNRFEPVPELEPYVVRSRIPEVLGEKDSWTAWVHLRPLSLNFWLLQQYPDDKNRNGGSPWTRGHRHPAKNHTKSHPSGFMEPSKALLRRINRAA